MTWKPSVATEHRLEAAKPGISAQQAEWEQGQQYRQQAAQASMEAAQASQRKAGEIGAAIPGGRAAIRQQAAQQMAAGRGLGSTSSHTGAMRQAAMERGLAIAQFDVQAAEAVGTAEEEAAAARVAGLTAQWEAATAPAMEQQAKVGDFYSAMADPANKARRPAMIESMLLAEPDPVIRSVIATFGKNLGMYGMEQFIIPETL